MTGEAARIEYDLALFLQLNEEYASKPIVPSPRRFDQDSLVDQARRRAKSINDRFAVQGERLLEVECGRGHLGRMLVDEYGCEYVGVDIAHYDDWEVVGGNDVSFIQQDLTDSDITQLGMFDLIISLAVLEHVVHPYAMLRAMFDLLAPGGTAYIAANLYRGPQASHRYRHVYFPWPHLLFDEAAWRAMAKRTASRGVNKLTYAQYLVYFDEQIPPPKGLANATEI